MSTISFEDFEKEYIEDILVNSKNSKEKGNKFAEKIIGDWLDFDSANTSRDDLVYCDGPGDGGIDIAFHERSDIQNDINTDNWYLVQSKFGKSFSGTDTLWKEAEKLFETLEGHRTNLSSLSSELIEKIKTFRSQAEPGKNKLVLTFATQRPLNEAEKRTVDRIRASGKDSIGDYFDVEAISIENIYNRQLESIQKSKKRVFSISAALVSSGPELLVGSVGLIKLYEF